MSSKNQYSNRLASATSPYLQQHAGNPVDWWPWCEEAIAAAREQEKLILLSIGYSACHWCHVMAHESFEDEATAAVMNQRFINIKVDREERPDLDKIYQTAYQILNQRPGGWPLTMIITPDDHMPFFAGTYFPVEAKHGMPAFREILVRVDDFYRNKTDLVLQQNVSLQQAMKSLEQAASENAELSVEPLNIARRQLEQQFDDQYAGFGKAPKFPHPSNLQRLMRYWHWSRQHGNDDQRGRDMCQLTLHAMSAGGLFDQLAGGFYRYSVDDMWMIPHFEKMLYDNGPLLGLFCQASLAFGQAEFAETARRTAGWVISEMQSPEGGYYSTLDADSEGEEGKYYLWTPAIVKNLLSAEEYAVVEPLFGLDRKANFEGRWHLHCYASIEDIALHLDIDEEHARRLLDSARKKLLIAREERVRPGRDEKILTSWNGLMMRGMALAGRYLNMPECTASAKRAVEFIRQNMLVDGRLLATYKDGKAHLMAYLDDYAFLIDGLLELLQTEWDETILELARELADALLDNFEDSEQGGFYFTANDHEKLIQRPKPVSDDALPAGNAIAALALNRLGIITGETRYINASRRTIESAWYAVKQAPYVHAAMLDAVEEQLEPPELVIIRAGHDEKQDWLKPLQEQYSPRRIVLFINRQFDISNPLLEAKAPATDHSLAYLCTGQTCLPPIDSVSGLMEMLN